MSDYPYIADIIVVTIIGLQFGAVLTGTIITETIFCVGEVQGEAVEKFAIAGFSSKLRSPVVSVGDRVIPHVPAEQHRLGHPRRRRHRRRLGPAPPARTDSPTA